MRLNTPQEVPATSGLMVDIVSRHLDFSSEERIRRSQYLRKRFKFGKVVHVSPHTSGASHILDHRESLFRPAKPLAMLRKMPPVTMSREPSSHVPRSFGKRRQDTRADDHVSARADTDSILHREIRRTENALRAFERIVALDLEDLQTVLSRHCCGLKCAQMPCVAFCVFCNTEKCCMFFGSVRRHSNMANTVRKVTVAPTTF